MPSGGPGPHRSRRTAREARRNRRATQAWPLPVPRALHPDRVRPLASGSVTLPSGPVIGVGRTGSPGPPSLRTVQADRPHTALQSVVCLTQGWRGRDMVRSQGQASMPGWQDGGVVADILQFTWQSRAVSIRFVQPDGSASARGLASPACLAVSGTRAGCRCISLYSANPPSCTPSLHRHCPASSLLWVLCLLPAALRARLDPERLLACRQISLVHTQDLPAILSPTTSDPAGATSARSLLTSRSAACSAVSGLRRSLAGSPRSEAESSFSRTDWRFTSGCSPPRLAATQSPSVTGQALCPEEDSHLLDLACSQAHEGGPPGPPSSTIPGPRSRHEPSGPVGGTRAGTRATRGTAVRARCRRARVWHA